MLVETLLPELAVEAFDVGVLNGLAGPNESQVHPAAIDPQAPIGGANDVSHIFKGSLHSKLLENGGDAEIAAVRNPLGPWQLLIEGVASYQRMYPTILLVLIAVTRPVLLWYAGNRRLVVRGE